MQTGRSSPSSHASPASAEGVPMTGCPEDPKRDTLVTGLVGREAVRIAMGYLVGCQVRLPGGSKGKESQG